MRALLTAAAALLLAAAWVPAYSGAAHDRGVGGPTDFAVGAARQSVHTFDFSAHAAPTAADPFAATGHFELNSRDGVQIFVRVTCLRVTGNRATLGGEVVRVIGVNFTAPGNEFVLFVEDNGEPGAGRDAANGHFSFPGGKKCPPLPPPHLLPVPIDHGNIVVHGDQG